MYCHHLQAMMAGKFYTSPSSLWIHPPILITRPTSTDYRDCRQILIGGIHLLLLQNPDDLPPSGDETNRDGLPLRIRLAT